MVFVLALDERIVIKRIELRCGAVNMCYDLIV
jgi:hypothetical protein